METQPLAWIGETEGSEREDAMVARYKELRARELRRREGLELALELGTWLLSIAAALGIVLVLSWAIRHGLQR